jgi:RNA polymerase sigma-70 factor (ECF subfamily)
MDLDVPSQKVHGRETVSTPEDTELLSRAQAGSVAAFEGLVALHRDRVYGLAQRMLNSPEDAAEVTQDAFLAAYRHLGEFRGDAQFGSWVYRITANQALMKLRHRKVVSQVESPLETEDGPNFNERGSLTDEVVPFGARGAEDQVLDAELRQAIEGAAAGLGEEYRHVFVLRDLEGLSYEEIAELTHSTVPAIKSRLHRARLALRAAIEQFYEERT